MRAEGGPASIAGSLSVPSGFITEIRRSPIWGRSPLGIRRPRYWIWLKIVFNIAFLGWHVVQNPRVDSRAREGDQIARYRAELSPSCACRYRLVALRLASPRRIGQMRRCSAIESVRRMSVAQPVRGDVALDLHSLRCPRHHPVWAWDGSTGASNDISSSRSDARGRLIQSEDSACGAQSLSSG